jgi:ribosome biogenesis GTPase
MVDARDPRDPGVAELRELLHGKACVFAGQSGVGKSSLVNACFPKLAVRVGDVAEQGFGRHTTTAARSFLLPGGGRLIDTPGIRSFGLAHIRPDDVVAPFSDLAHAVADCPRGCGHRGPPADPECALDRFAGAAAARTAAARRLLTVLAEAKGY